MADVLALNDRSTYTERIAHTETVGAVTVEIYACDTGLWMGQRDLYHRAEFDGDKIALGAAGEGDLPTAIRRAREIAAEIAA